MVRLFVDKLGTGHNDMFLKIEDKLTIADSYYLPDFLELEDEVDITTSLLCSHLIDYWISLINQIEKNKPLFLPFALSDQCVGGILILKTKKYISLKYVSIVELDGYSMNLPKSKEIISLINKDYLKKNTIETFIIDETFLIKSLYNSKLQL